MNSIQYAGDIAKRYNSDAVREHPLSMLVHQCWLHEVGDIRGLRVLDLACGGGHTSRMLADRNAHVVGVDISEEMIMHARGIEEQQKNGIVYHVGDAVSFDLGLRFRLVTPSFLFHYAKTEAEMRRFAATAYRHLFPGGRMVALNAWHSIVPCMENASHWSEWVDPSHTDIEGARVRLHLLDGHGNEACTIEYQHWKPETYERVLYKAGFRNVRWVHHRIPAELRERYPNWRELERHNASCVLTARRPS